MRLLHTSSLRLEEFFQNIPRYAILSHTWSEGEVLFEDIDTKDVTRKKGWVKVKRACEIANSAGYDRIWIDTCCIDKKSSAELSEAINSMYRWYAQSDICYVYLEDFRVSPSSGAITHQSFPMEIHQDTLKDFIASRWFTRGWTLQELIAPNNVLFLSSEWLPFGTRDNPKVLEAISKRTRISDEVFWHKDMRRIGIAERISWMSDRQTSRVEDQAYCLLGICNINMPMLYGEGKGAFIRLQEAIIAQIDDHSIFSWQSLPGQEHHEDAQLLARNPSAFANFARPVAYLSERQTGPYHMTNQGLQITLDLLVLPNRCDNVGCLEAFALFNCQARFARFSNEIAIPVIVDMDQKSLRLRGHYKATLRKGSQVTHRVHLGNTQIERGLGHMKIKRLPLMITTPSSETNYGQPSYAVIPSLLRDREYSCFKFFISTGENISVLDKYPQGDFHRIRSESWQRPWLAGNELGMTTDSDPWALFLRRADHDGRTLDFVLFVHSIPKQSNRLRRLAQEPVFLLKFVNSDPHHRWDGWPWYVIYDQLWRKREDVFVKLQPEQVLIMHDVTCIVKKYQEQDRRFSDMGYINYVIDIEATSTDLE